MPAGLRDRAQLDAVFADLPPAAVKTGMLLSEPIIATVAGALSDYPGPVVLDPVMIASSGARLLEPAAVRGPGWVCCSRWPPWSPRT